MSDNYLSVNKALWNARVQHHVGTVFYAMDAFKQGKTSLNEIELSLLGDINGQEILHLQCHFGQDTLSLARMGAHVTGLDFSEDAIEQATALATELQLPANFICCDVHDAASYIKSPVDTIFTTYGVLGWLPDLDAWARVVAQCLQSGGRLLLVEFHPFIWMYNADFTNLQYPYFNTQTIMEMEEGSYTDEVVPIATLPSITWNHPLSEVMTSLLAAGFDIRVFREYDHSPYSIFEKCTETAPGRYQVAGIEGKIPMVYALEAIRK